MQEKHKSCELCGKRSSLREAIIEGSLLSVCNDCLSFGKAVIVPKHIEARNVMRRKIVVEQEIEIVVPNYSQLIKLAREKLGLKQEELAKIIAEKESVIHRLESGILKPTLDLARKLEKTLKITLIKKYEESKGKTIDFSDSSLTVGDILKMKK